MAKTKAPELSDVQLDADAEKTGVALGRAAKVRVKIPIDPNNKGDLVVPVLINGHMYRINRGQTVYVPEVVAEVLEQGGYI